MDTSLDRFAKAVRDAREKKEISQRELAQRLGMNTRTIMDLEIGRSNPKAETVFLISKELHISLDTLVFTDTDRPNAVSADVLEFFSGKSDSESSAYIELCRRIGDLIQKSTLE